MGTKLELDSKIRINASSVLSPTDIDILNLLYGPLLKEEACHLYLAMYSLLNRVNLECQFTLKELIDILNTNKKSFTDSKMKLEALNLLQTHVSDTDYLLLLKTPLSAKQFLTDGVLGMYLYSMIGDTSFKSLQKLFEIPKIDKTQYEEVSASFDDVFESKAYGTVTTNNYLLDKKVNQGVIIKNKNFDFEVFKNGISSAFLDGRRFSKKFEKFIIDTAYAYGFNEAEMRELYEKSINKNSGYFDYQACTKNAASLYRKNHEDKLPELALKEKKESDIKELFKTLSAKELLQGITGKNPSANDLSKVDELYHLHEDLERDLLNVLVVYSVKKCDGEVPNLKYFEKVLEDWQKRGELSFEAALEYMNGEPKQNSKGYRNKNKPEQDIPDWLEEYHRKFEERVEDL